MAKDNNRRGENEMLSCRSCGEEFLVTSPVPGPIICPRCGKAVRSASRGRLLRLAIFALVVALAVIAAVFIYRAL